MSKMQARAKEERKRIERKLRENELEAIVSNLEEEWKIKSSN